MVRIAVRTECDINYLQRFKDRKNMSSPDVTNAISHATCTMAGDLNAAAILAVSKSGRTARMISKYRPYSPDHRRVPDGESIPSARTFLGRCTAAS